MERGIFKGECLKLNIKGNRFRLITEISYRFGRIYVRHVTHAQYDQEKMKTMSTATAQPEYAALLARTLPAVIHTEKENKRCSAMLEALDHKAEKLTAAERRLEELLTVLIEDFEEQAYALKPARPVEVLRELMASNGLKQKDLLDIFGTPSIASEVLREKRGLTNANI